MARNAAGSAAETVLVVEDESAVLRLSKLVLERLGYVGLTAIGNLQFSASYLFPPRAPVACRSAIAQESIVRRNDAYPI